MYQQRNSFRSGSRGRHNRSNSNRSFGRNRSGRGRFQPKQLDPRLFIKPADAVQSEAAPVTSTFSDFKLPKQLVTNLSSMGFDTPTPIQDQALTPILNGHDLIGLADTGTGKTIAFVLPILAKLIKDPAQNALIIAPTRELAVQIKDDIRALSNGLPIKTVLLIGGTGIYRQIQELKRNPHIFIGTPGRLKDLHERGSLNLNNTHTIVLDEMDRMLDMGFVKDITKLLSYLPKERQTLLFSATIDDRVEGIAHTFMTNPLKISVKTGATAQNVDQDVVRLSGSDKISVLKELLKQQRFQKVLIFGRTKYGVEKLSVTLSQNGFSVGAIHGNKRQSQRQRVLTDFKTNRINILVATDVAARGIDVKDITHVINYDQPDTYADYIHRIGRTGRAGKTGQALTFVE